MSITDRPILQTFDLIVQLALLLDPENTTRNTMQRFDVPGDDGSVWTVRINRKTEIAERIPRFHAAVDYNGLPAGMMSPFDGVIAAGSAANEEAFCAAVTAEIARLNSQPPAARGATDDEIHT